MAGAVTQTLFPTLRCIVRDYAGRLDQGCGAALRYGGRDDSMCLSLKVQDGLFPLVVEPIARFLLLLSFDQPYLG